MASLPIIDISPFLDPSSSRESRLATAESLDHACRTVGFFYLSHHSIPTAELAQILSLAHSFFALPSSTKEAIKLLPAGVEDGDGARGYQTIGENVTQGKRDWHEGLDLYRPVPDSCPPFKPVMGRNKWPPGEFREVYEAYIAKILALGQAVMRAMALGLGEDESYFQKFVDQSFWVMRAIGYPPLETTDEGGISCGEHTGLNHSWSLANEDYGCLTFLIADLHAKGSLQVKLPATGEWISADPIEGCFVCNIGDMIWTNNQYRSTLHRVIHKSSRYRVSVPFFFEPNFDAVISPLQSCLDKDSGERKVPEKVVYGHHLLSKVAGNFYIGPAPS